MLKRLISLLPLLNVEVFTRTDLTISTLLILNAKLNLFSCQMLNTISKYLVIISYIYYHYNNYSFQFISRVNQEKISHKPKRRSTTWKHFIYDKKKLVQADWLFEKTCRSLFNFTCFIFQFRRSSPEKQHAALCSTRLCCGPRPFKNTHS